MNMAEMVSRTREHLGPSGHSRLAVLKQAWTAPGDNSETTLQFTAAPQQVFPGMMISAGLMNWYTTQPPSAGGTEVKVIPGVEHYDQVDVPAGTIARLSPRHNDRNIFTTLNDQIVAMGSPLHGLFGTYSWQQSANLVNRMYDIPVEASGYASVLSVKYRASGGVEDWYEVRKWDVRPELGQIKLYDRLGSGTVVFTVKMPFQRATSLTDDPTVVCGLGESMLDIPPLGAAGMLLQQDEGRRVSLAAQGDPRQAEETPATALATQGREFLRLRDRRIRDEAAALVAMHSYQYRLI